MNSLLLLREKPSAMLDIADTAADWIWFIGRKSLLKRVLMLIASYTQFTKFLAAFQASISSKRVNFMCSSLLGSLGLLGLLGLLSSLGLGFMFYWTLARILGFGCRFRNL